MKITISPAPEEQNKVAHRHRTLLLMKNPFLSTVITLQCMNILFCKFSKYINLLALEDVLNSLESPSCCAVPTPFLHYFLMKERVGITG